MARILVTGSRDWQEEEIVARALGEHAKRGDTLIHGASVDRSGRECGADWMADRLWRPHGRVELYPAADFRTPLERNAYMVSLGADVCLAFAYKWASGTGHCARRARERGIETIDFGVDTVHDWIFSG